MISFVKIIARILVGLIFILTAYDILDKGVVYIKSNLTIGIYGLANQLAYFLCTTIGEIPAAILFAMSGALVVLYPLLRKKMDNLS